MAKKKVPNPSVPTETKTEKPCGRIIEDIDRLGEIWSNLSDLDELLHGSEHGECVHTFLHPILEKLEDFNRDITKRWDAAKKDGAE